MKILYLTLLISLVIISEVNAQRKAVLELSARIYNGPIDYSKDTILPLHKEGLIERQIIELDEYVRDLKPSHNKIFFNKINFTKAFFKDEAHICYSTFKDYVVFDSAFFNEYTCFTNTKFVETGYFNYTTFRKETRFVNIFGGVDFDNACFLDTAFFNESSFINTSTWNQTVFERYVSFDHCNFVNALFYDAKFNASANFVNIQLSSLKGLIGLSFGKAIFNKSVTFDRATINQDIAFNGAFFKSTLSLQNASFRQSINFSAARINRALNLSNIILYDSAKFFFLNAVLPDTINLSRVAKIPNEIDLIVANFKDSTRYNKNDGSYKYHYINLYKTDITKLHIDYTHFRLLLTDPETNQTLPSDECKAQYEALLKNFKDRGQMDSYELLDIEYHDYKWKQRNALISWWRYVCKSWYMYGYERERIFLWTIGLIAFFTCITFWRLDTLSRDVYPFSNMHSLPTLQNIKEYKLGYKAYKTRLWYSFLFILLPSFFYSG